MPDIDKEKKDYYYRDYAHDCEKCHDPGHPVPKPIIFECGNGGGFTFAANCRTAHRTLYRKQRIAHRIVYRIMKTTNRILYRILNTVHRTYFILLKRMITI